MEIAAINDYRIKINAVIFQWQTPFIAIKFFIIAFAVTLHTLEAQKIFF